MSRYRKLIQEFRTVFHQKVPTHMDDTDGIVVLSAAPERDRKGYIIREDSEENRTRIQYAVELAYFSGFPPVILNGEDEQLFMMRTIARETYRDMERIFLSCGPRGEANTKTQFLALRDDRIVQNMNHLTIITSGYHVPRVRRTAEMYLVQAFDVLAVPYAYYPFNIFKVRGEIQRIINYQQKGDIR